MGENEVRLVEDGYYYCLECRSLDYVPGPRKLSMRLVEERATALGLANRPDSDPGGHREESGMTISVFIGTSVDGFIARCNGDLDFLPEGGGEPHGYNEFIAGVDAIVIGRNTFAKVLTFAAWPYGDKRVVVLSSRPVDLSAASGVVEQMAGPPDEIVSQLAASGAQHLYVDGGNTIQRFLRAGLVHRLIITRVPVLIGYGIPLFGTLPHDLRLRHVKTQHYPSGLVQSEYHLAT